MTTFGTFSISDLFIPTNGKARFTRDYLDAHPGEYPVYSAALTSVFGYADSYDFNGEFLTWVMNGYGGRMQQLSGTFSANRDRGVLVPLSAVETPDLTYVRYVLEPVLRDLAVGRREDGRKNEYTKIYPTEAGAATIELPVTPDGELDHGTMRTVGERIRRIELANDRVAAAGAELSRAQLKIDCPEPFVEVSLGDNKLFALSIGSRRLMHENGGGDIPVFSANVQLPFGHIGETSLTDFSKPSLLWGIDGIFDWNIIEAEQPFETTDHCGRLQLQTPDLDPRYVYNALQSVRAEPGFDRVFRASLGNMKSNVRIRVPVDETGRLSLKRQKALAQAHDHLVGAKATSLDALSDVLRARLGLGF